MNKLIHFDEPPLLFNYNQPMLDPRDGLTLFGPLERAKPEGIRWAVIGPKTAIARLKHWVDRINSPVLSKTNPIARPLFPGFEATFNTRLANIPVLESIVPEYKLRENAYNADKHQRVYRTVQMYASRILNALRTEDVRPDIWFVVIPEYIYQNCRPRSVIPQDLRVLPETSMRVGTAKDFSVIPSLFEEDNLLAEEYLYEVNFHHQLKARLLHQQIPTQIVREIKIAFRDFTDSKGRLLYGQLEAQESAIAWNLTTAAFYKAGGRPWKLGAARDGVCYIGLVFKQDERAQSPRTACCAAQMFLDSGDGVVFKGAVGPWYRGRRGLFHLDRPSAKNLVEICLNAYKEKHNGNPPKELFIHGRITFDNEEWAGFQAAAGIGTKVVGVRIRPVTGFKLFRMKTHPVLRGIAYLKDERTGFLWTKGMVPRLKTYPGREVPNPLLIDVCRGKADIQTVMADILALTKLNYNSCTYGDGLPVTLRFANAVGEILTAGPSKKLSVPPLPFKYYI
jgi:hypothetical protein